MARYSIKKVKYDGYPSTALGSFPQSYGIEDDDIVLNAQGRKIITEMMKSWKEDYKEHGDEIGTIRAEYFLERHHLDYGVEFVDGKNNGLRFDGTNKGKDFFELVLKIFVPLTGMSFKATDVHTYRYNVRNNEFELEESEIL